MTTRPLHGSRDLGTARAHDTTPARPNVDAPSTLPRSLETAPPSGSPRHAPLAWDTAAASLPAPSASAPPTATSTSGDTYAAQDRGTVQAYVAYWEGMNKTMQQKVGLTTAHFPPSGTIADMGAGSGQATYDLAALFGALKVIGIDINPVAVEAAQRTHRLQNLEYVVGDVAERVLPAASLDAILNSSTLHHVTSFNDFDVRRVLRSLDHQVEQLKPGGVLVIRDFVIPRGPERVWLDLPTTGGLAPTDSLARVAEPDDLSPAARFERFARDFRSSQNPSGPVPYDKRSGADVGWQRYELTLRAATEFVLHKDYTKDWDVELREEYTYMSQSQFESAFAERGLRIVASREIHNPWIVENRLDGKCRFFDLEGRALPTPPTNFVIVGEKVGKSAVLLRETASQRIDEPRFVRLTSFRRHDTGAIFDLVHRPHETLDVLPWYSQDGRLYVLAKQGFPRPVLKSAAATPSLDGATLAGYITEPIAAIVPPAELEGGVSRATLQRILTERAALPESSVRRIEASLEYYPSPGGLQERVRASLVEIEPRADKIDLAGAYGDLSTAGQIRPLEATQVLRAHHVDGMFDARLELNVYALLLARGASVGPWAGAEVKLQNQAKRPKNVVSAREALAPTDRAVFAPTSESAGFLEVRRGEFTEVDARGETLARAHREYVVPTHLSTNTATVLPVVKAEGELYVGLELRELPAAQLFSGSSTLATPPAWRLPKTVTNDEQARRALREKLTGECGLGSVKLAPLGGRYYPSAGVTPEQVLPWVAEVQGTPSQALTWVKLADLVASHREIRDAHLAVSVLRLAHATGLLP